MKKIKFYITRDKDGTLFFHKSKPIRFGNAFFPTTAIGSINTDQLPSVTWENSPQQIEIRLVGEFEEAGTQDCKV